MALPTTGISTSLVKTEIGAGSNDVGTLCTHPNINKWSKWKPIRFNKIDGITTDNLEAVNYGINIKSYASVASVISAYQNSEEVWEYLRPQGGSYSEPYRLGDFRNYEKDAIAPAVGYAVTNRASNTGGGGTVSGSMMINSDPSIYEIGWEDLNLDGRRLMLVISDRDGVVRTAVAPSPIDTTVSTDVANPSLPAGTYLGHVMLSNPAGTTTSNLAGLPNHPVENFAIEILSNVVVVSVEAGWRTGSPNDVSIVVKCTNQMGSPVLLTNCSIKVRSTSNDCSAPIQAQEVLINIGDIYAQAGTTTIYTNSVTVIRSYYPSWKICWSNGGSYASEFGANIITQMD